MADIGAMIAAALLKEVVQQIGSLVGGQIKLQQNLDKDLKEMKAALESIEALLKDAEHANTNNSMRLWLSRLRDAMYGIADMIDDFEAETTRKFSIKKHLGVMMPCFPIGPKFTMANKMKTMREELQGITDQYQKFMLVPATNADEPNLIQMRETSSTIEASIIGRTEEENKIWVSLSENIIEELIVLAIHGIGGLGKTTLAKMIYNNKTKFEDYVRVWIYVSETFDLNKIGNSLISQLSENESLYTEKHMIHRSLAKLLANKKILIILDDLWAEDDSQLDSLIAMLNAGRGSRVVVIATTRNEEIARKISTIPPHELASLTDEMCWTIIKGKSGFESRDDKEQLKHIGEAIAAKCGGVALATQSIGPILKTMNYNKWKKVRDSDIWKESPSSSDPKDKAATRVLASLRLSYTLMPRYLKLCFGYWAIFPKGYKISKGDLIHQWISLSFIGTTPTLTAWELGEMYITQLLMLSFLEHSKIARFSYGLADVAAFTMHDLVHDLARSVMDDEILLAGNDGNIGGNRCHYALLNDCSKPLDSPRIRAIRFMGSAGILPDAAAFACAKSLRVLDLSECSIHKLTDSIGRFKQLRYLNAPRVPHEVIPDSITRLSKLAYLSLRQSFLSVLPESIGEMEGLMYLDLSGCKEIKELPESFGKLKKLVHLDLSECSALENISKFMWSLTDLQYLNLSICSSIASLPESLDGLTSLQYLNLSRCFQEGQNDSLMDRLSALSSLEHLDLSWNPGITSLPESFCNLRKLHTLDLSYCIKIQKIPESMGKIDSLKTLYLKGCDALVEKPVPHPSTSFVSLPRFEVRIGDDESSSNLVCLHDTNPQRLEIVWLENVKSAEEAQSIKLMKKNNLKRLTLSWTEGAERFVDDKVLLEKLVPPKSLTDLKIIGYNGVSLPTWVGQQYWVTLSHMEHLEELSVSDSSGMSSELSINDCPKLRMGPLLPRAVGWLKITESDNVLSSWGEGTISSTGASSSSSSVLTSVQRLTVVDSNLAMQQWRLLRHLSGLEHLYITSCPDLTVSHDIIPHLSSVTWLEISTCNISSLPHWVMDLTGLKYLGIYHCRGIGSLPEGIQQLTKLQKLWMDGCPDLRKWCESVENKMKLAHIKHKIARFPVDVAFTMHDLVHDLARSVMDDEILLAGNDGNIGGNRCHYALLNDCSKPLDSPRIRAIRFMGSAGILPDAAAFACAKSLRVLDLSECSINKLTDSIGRFKQLRYLNAPRVPHEVIPDSITSLSKLAYLSLRQSFLLSALPESIGEMEGLMYLDLSGCMEIKELPESFGKLKKLVHLDLSECTALENISKFMWSLTDLQYLNFDGCPIGSLPEPVDGLTSLQYLNLSRCFREGQNLCNLRSALSSLRHLRSLSSLEHLDLSWNDGITSLPESFCNLRKLHTLDLSHCRNIQKIPESMGRIDSLKTLYLKGCYALVEKPVPHPSTSFVSLPRFEVRTGDGESSSNLVCLHDKNTQELEIVWLENVKSAEEAQSIKLMGKNNLKMLTLSWTEGAERFVDDKVLLEKLVPPKSSTVLKIIGYNGVSLPTWVSQQNAVTLSRMKHLEELSLSDSSGMSFELSINDCPKLRMGPLLPRAVGRLEIRGSDNVLSLWGECTISSTGASSSSSSILTSVQRLTVADSNLPMQQWRLLRHLSGLEHLYIKSCCPDLTVSHDIIPHLSSVTWLVINTCNISSLPHWVIDLTGLEQLGIMDCRGVRSLPEDIQQLTELRTLHIYGCPDLRKWCESEENKMKLAHIENKEFH